MGGTYTVGATGANYTTIGAAVTALSTAGLCGPVILNIQPGRYKERVTVPTIAGSSKDNYIIFKSSTGNKDDVLIIDSLMTYTSPFHVWRFENCRYMTLRDVTVLGKGTYNWGLQIMGTGVLARNINIKNCNVIMTDSNNASLGYQYAMVVNGSATSATSGGKIDSLQIDSNNIRYGYYGLVMFGASTASRQDDNDVRNNTFYGAYYYGNYIQNQSGLRYRNNILKPRNNTTTMQYGLYMTSVGQYLTSAASEISGNYFTGAASYTIYMQSCDNSPVAKGLFQII